MIRTENSNSHYTKDIQYVCPVKLAPILLLPIFRMIHLSILPPRVRVPGTPSMLLSICIWIVSCIYNRRKSTKKRPGLAHLKKQIEGTRKVRAEEEKKWSFKKLYSNKFFIFWCFSSPRGLSTFTFRFKQVAMKRFYEKFLWSIGQNFLAAFLNGFHT